MSLLNILKLMITGYFILRTLYFGYENNFLCNQFFYLTNISQFLNGAFYIKLVMSDPSEKGSLLSLQKHYLQVLSTSTFVAIVYWLMFLTDPKLIIDNEERYRNNSFLFLYTHGINTTILTIEIHSLEILQFIQQNSHATQILTVIRKHFCFFAFYCFL